MAEIFMRGVSSSSTQVSVVLMLAEYLHQPAFMGDAGAPFNFHVHLLRDKVIRTRHCGMGFLTLPTAELGARFLQFYGASGLDLNGYRISFSWSKKPQGRPENIEEIRLMPYIDPRTLEEQRAVSDELSRTRVSLKAIQFGWDCRDSRFSIESEASPEACFLTFDEERRQFRVEFIHERLKHFIAIRFSQIGQLSAHTYLHREPVIVLTTLEPPTYEVDMKPCQVATDTGGGGDNLMDELLQQFMSLTFPDSGPKRKQLSFLPLFENHEKVVPYISMAVRLVCETRYDLDTFRTLSNKASFHSVGMHEVPVLKRGLFSAARLEQYGQWTRNLPWTISFQIMAIVNKRSVDLREMLDILPDIERLRRAEGDNYTALLLQDFAPKVHSLWQSEEREDREPEAVRRCFERAARDFRTQPPRRNVMPTDGSLYQAYHATVTPTTITMDGPHPERSNRVIRAYGEEHQESFLRVTFAEEGRLQFRFDKDVDSREYIKDRIRPLLMDGLTIGRRTFHFLAYSQSALKEHSVWFVKPFQDDGKWVTAKEIIASLGKFDSLEFDPELTRCPARYAARISQAFTATDASVKVNIEEIIPEDDFTIITDGQEFNFTDGVGTMSLAVAEEIWRKLRSTRKRLRSVRGCPAAYQIRFAGSKGMLSVNHRLQGRLIVLRPSMIKFEAPEENNIEIARAFDRPTPYFLNRPLIMLMEGLGVQYEVFKHYQDLAVQETEESVHTFSKAGKLLECYGLGSSFRLSSVMNSLHKLGITTITGDTFYDKALEFAKNHILRLLKNHARIPIPGAWTLVGVADVHRFLQPGEVFAYVRPLNGPAVYLEGPVVISRSPTIHPGDIQLARAIGRPPPGSCFERQPLANTVVFSVLGDRPLSSCLGGGDLDGDVYNIIPLSDPDLPALAGFRPQRTYRAAKYPPVQKKLLPDGQQATMKDVADFVMDYIVSDVLGIVAINWLIIADQSPDGVMDPDCLTLANLHSDAVDYPKSGNPVDRDRIPKLKHKLRPDWNAPETVDVHMKRRGNRYYESQRAIGKLFRAIDLPAQQEDPMRNATRISRRRNRDAARAADIEFSCFADDRIYTLIEMEVEKYIATEEYFNQHARDEAEELLERYTTELQGICITKTLSSARNASLTEEEAMIGTIVQKTSQPRRRTDMIARLRESTDVLVRGVRENLEGGEEDTEEDFLQRAWFAWQVSLDKGREFGAQSFGWVALGGVFEAIRKIEEREIGRRVR